MPSYSPAHSKAIWRDRARGAAVNTPTPLYWHRVDDGYVLAPEAPSEVALVVYRGVLPLTFARVGDDVYAH